MGLLDIPSPLFAWIDARLFGVLPPLLTICAWGIVGALVSMELYRMLSPQGRIAALKAKLVRAQERLSAYDGELGDAWPLIRRMLGLAFRRVGIVLPATLAASLPLLALIVWLDTSYGRAFPEPGQEGGVSVEEPYRGALVSNGGASPPKAEVRDDAGTLVAEVELGAPVPVVHKKRWWNVLIGNPAGYLDSAAPVDAIGIDLPRRHYLDSGPDWLRGWEAAFFAALILSSLGFKIARRIQ